MYLQVQLVVFGLQINPKTDQNRQNSSQAHQNSPKTHPDAPRPTWLDQGGRPPGRPQGRLPSRPGLGGNFPAWLVFCIFEICFVFLITSEGHISVILTPIFEISDSISRIFPRRTQPQNPIPLILILYFNYTQICNS